MDQDAPLLEVGIVLSESAEDKGREVMAWIGWVDVFNGEQQLDHRGVPEPAGPVEHCSPLEPILQDHDLGVPVPGLPGQAAACLLIPKVGGQVSVGVRDHVESHRDSHRASLPLKITDGILLPLHHSAAMQTAIALHGTDT